MICAQARLIVDEFYSEASSDFLKPLLELLTHSRSMCGGDTDKFLIMLVIGSRTNGHPDFGRLTSADLESGRIPVLPSLGTNVRSIADSLRMPRETVRRKVQEMIEAGWIVRQHNELRVTFEAYMTFAPVRQGIGQMAVRYTDIVTMLMAAHGAVRDAPPEAASEPAPDRSDPEPWKAARRR